MYGDIHPITKVFVKRASSPVNATTRTLQTRSTRPPTSSVSSRSILWTSKPVIDQTKRHWQVPRAQLRRRLVCETSLSIPSARSCKTGKRKCSHHFYGPGNKHACSPTSPIINPHTRGIPRPEHQVQLDLP